MMRRSIANGNCWMRRWSAAIFGTKTLRIFAFLPKDGKTDDTSVYPRSYELLKEAAARAKPRGFNLAVENLRE